MVFPAAFATVVLGTFLGACSQTAGPIVLVGDWGGEHIGMVVHSDSATIEYDCAHGAIDEAIRPDSRGRFTATGTYTREHGGPIRDDEIPDEQPARYEGTVFGRELTLKVTLTESGVVIGSYGLERAASPQVFKCL
jgi:hypothetical protein